ncbi:hypothetical protein L1D32_05950 [Shewanella insulae]|uniref:hypothetical protein n=1 Tax=Shewanella insulae TaxID=2681496 RepID=UPI001EFEAB9F|nr:hypothetical protein [Shewanella insulae]MCG9737694.1 hypothetical protein [Shewanella insulae]
MKLLRSMTGASQETRLVFLTWACVLGNNFQHGKKDDLAAALQVSKRHLNVALEYLVREGYLWKIKSSVKPMMGEKRGGRFDYGITSKAWGMWLELLSGCCWKEELRLILRRYAVGKVKAEKPTHFTAKMHLVWIALMLSSNKAGYVLAIENSFFSEVLGMTEAQIRRTVRALVRVGVVSIVAAKLARTTLFGSMLPVYKIHPQSSQWKIIRVGITRNDMEFDPIRLLRHLISYEQVATVSMRSKKGKLPIQSSCFLDDQYFRLSKKFRSMKLKAIVQQACLAIVFSHALNNLAARLSGASRPHGRQNSLSEPHQATLTVVNQPANYQDLCCRVSFELSNSLSCGDVVSFEKMEREERGPNKITENEIFRAFIINELTNDIVNLIQILSKELKVFVDSLGDKLRVLSYQKHQPMVVILPVQEASLKQSQDTDSSEEAYKLLAPYVLEVLVPNEEKYSDCLIYAGELYMANSRVKHPKIRQVDKLVCL